MLTHLTIEGFMRIPFANIDLTGAAIHAFYGVNEAGKSSIAESVRFVYRGVSRRIKKKGDFDLLVTQGKRTGSVELIANDIPIRRNIKDGNLTTRASFDFDDLHVDLQLGAEEFARVEEAKLRPLLMSLLKAKIDETAVKERLVAIGVSDRLLEEIVPVIKRAGFASAHEYAKNQKSQSTGAWRATTGETYGHVKAETWRHELMDQTPPTEEQIAKMQQEVQRLTSQRDSYKTALAIAKTTLELTGMVSDGTTVEDAQAALQVAEAHMRECAEQVTQTEARYAKAINDDEEKLRKAEHALIDAKNAATQLSCPHCQTALQIVMIDKEPVLERAVEERNGTANVAAAATAVQNAREALQARKQSRDSTMTALRKAYGDAQDAVHQERATFDNVRKLANMPRVTKDELENLQSELQLISEPLDKAQAKLDEMQLGRKHFAEAQKKTDQAKEHHRTAQQWALVEEACGPTSAGIPAELIGRITKPLNAAIAKIAEMWGAETVMVTAEMSVQRADGMPYVLMSESAQWRTNAMIQLALAQLTDLKVVAIDRFDVALARGAFFDMLSQYTELNPGITVLAFGSLKNTPPPFPGVKFHHVDSGAVHTIQHAPEAAHAD